MVRHIKQKVRPRQGKWLGPAARFCGRLNLFLHKKTHPDETTMVSLIPDRDPRGRVLVSYIVEAFDYDNPDDLPKSHTHYRETMEMAAVFLKLGYAVDVISYRNTTFRPVGNYDFFIGCRINFERIAGMLNSSCIKIAHMDMCHWLLNNTSAVRRCLELQGRRGVTLASYKLQEENHAVENADYITILGNDFVRKSYAYAGKPIIRLPIPACVNFPAPADKNYDSCRRNYLWLGSKGLIHKGLDLVIEAFLDLPDYNLTICGPVNNDKDRRFEQVFSRELYKTPNIRTVGWINVAGEEFRRIAAGTLALVYPSAAEGGGGNVVTCMHAGIIPVVNYEASVDVDNRFGVMLPDSSIDEIKKAIVELSDRPAEQLQSMSGNAWKEANEKYTISKYGAELEKFIKDIQPSKAS